MNSVFTFTCIALNTGAVGKKNLISYCQSVTYYKRKKIYNSFPFRLPFIVSSRANQSLLSNLLKDDYPVLLEGIHCTYFLFSGELKNKKVFVRLHNVEYEYYEELAKTTKNILRKLYFQHESNLLKKYEKQIAGKAMFIAVSEKDKDTYEQNFLAIEVKYLPGFSSFHTCGIGAGQPEIFAFIMEIYQYLKMKKLYYGY